MIIADTVNKQIYELIRAMILERQLQPGERIDPNAIAKANNVSLMPVRNALQQLTVQGLVVTKQRVGIFVREFSKEDILQLFDTRIMFEAYCMEQYFNNISEQEALYLFQQQQRMEPVSGDAMRMMDDNLHSMIVEASDNPFLIKQYRDMSLLFRMSFYNDAVKEDADFAKEEHLRILDAICSGDKRRAVTELKQHLQRASREAFSRKVNDETPEPYVNAAASMNAF